MFSYAEYGEIVKAIQESGRGAGFSQALERERFIIMRHDVEFSVDRAYDLSRFEKSLGFTSTYFFQCTNNSYNLFSGKNRNLIEQMRRDGHTVGLHFNVGASEDAGEVTGRLATEIRAMSELLGFSVTVFSIHRPSAWALRENLGLPGILNAYGRPFFSYAENVTAETPLRVRYFSDARHQWNYGLVPDRETLQKYDRVQILTHPYSWTPEGYGNVENFRTLVAERTEELLNTIDGECQHFAQARPLL